MTRLAIAGKSNMACDFLNYVVLKHPDIDVVVLPSKSDLPHDGWQRSLAQTARALRIPIAETMEDFYATRDLIFLSLEYDAIIDPTKFSTKRLFNIHFSALPKYAGVYTSITPILGGEMESGVTLHEIDSGIDSGAIIAQEIFSIEDLSAIELYNKYNSVGFSIVKEYFLKLVVGNFNSSPQANERSYFCRNSIDFSLRNITHRDLGTYTCKELHNIIRAFTFPVYQRATFEGREILASKIFDADFIGTPQVVFHADNSILATCTNGIIQIFF